jgi:hypothetical protein
MYATRAGRALAPYRLHLFLLAYAPVLLVLDGVLEDLRPQLGLGVLTFAVLWICTRTVARPLRIQVWVCVVVATFFEIFGSLIWGGYTYRLHNIPLYVPPGHGMVYLFGVTAASLPLLRTHARTFRLIVCAACTAWAIAGVTFLPLVTHRLDLLGLACLPLFLWCVLRTSRGTMFAAMWIAVANLEIAGTWAGDWRWAETAPWNHLPAGNPPSAIAAGYAIIDGSVAIVAPLVVLALAAAGRRLRRGQRSPGEPSPAAPGAR